MKKLTNTRITFNVSTWDEYNHDYQTDDFVYSFSEPKTIKELTAEAYNTISEYTYGIARIYWGKYQIGTTTKKGCDIDEYLTAFGKKLSGKNKEY